jgi:hypothetical protein
LVTALGLGLGAGTAPATALGQVRERDVTITGPRGRTIERKLESQRGPGYLDRQTTIVRPGGTYTRDVQIQRGPAFAPGGRGGWAGPRGFWGPPGRVFVERPVVVGGWGPSPGASFGLGAGLGALFGTGAGLLLGQAMSQPAAPPPPVVVAPAPVYVAPGAVPASAVTAAPAPPPAYAAPASPGFDPVADAVGRLNSWHENSRRDGALTLGRLGDPRAVPALVDRLKNDRSKDVRIAAATAIGQIGDPGSAVVLQRAIVYDKTQAVRDAAAAALARMPREIQQAGASANAAAPPITSTPAPVPGGTTPDFRPVDGQPAESVPPPPTPALPDARGRRS